MAHRVVRDIVNLEVMESSDEEDFLLIPPPLEPIPDEDHDDHNELRLFHPIFGVLQRIDHVKVINYVENIVRNYDNMDFIMHFRLSRVVAYRLIDQFSVSEIFTSLQGHESASYRDVADRFGITLSALYNIISRVTDFILTLANDVIRYPNAAEKAETAAFYQNTKGFPGIIGAIDGSHIRIDRPAEDPDSYINRKQYFSVNLQGTVNHEMKFLDVFIGYPGSVHDARVFRNSPLYRDLRELCTDNYHLLGDSAYPCLIGLMVPYRDNGHLTRAQRTFNRKLSSCRVIIENAFGCLKQRFRQLYHLKLRDIGRIVSVIHACCVLHNMASARDLEFLEPPMNNEYPDAQNDVQEDEVHRDYESGVHIRNEICQQLLE
ncbi:putative nuclease HARBI1 [Temnothorax nylanderi]|uniref:putative nuclease HARBI1 n=1 Tax=Temnothorax nylanderi TaxID=102681 RepID=UPI003A88C44A